MNFLEKACSFMYLAFSPSKHHEELGKNNQRLAEIVCRLSAYEQNDTKFLKEQTLRFSRLTTLLDDMRDRVVQIEKLKLRILEEIVKSDTLCETEFRELQRTITHVMQEIALNESGGLLAINQEVSSLNEQIESLEQKLQGLESMSKRIDKASFELKTAIEQVVGM